NRLRDKGFDTVSALLEAGRVRLRPILMTSVATVVGAIPIALGLGAGSISRRPLGYAIVGGLVFSTALTLFLVPVVYSLMEGGRSGLGAWRRAAPGRGGAVGGRCPRRRPSPPASPFWGGRRGTTRFPPSH